MSEKFENFEEYFKDLMERAAAFKKDVDKIVGEAVTDHLIPAWQEGWVGPSPHYIVETHPEGLGDSVVVGPFFSQEEAVTWAASHAAEGNWVYVQGIKKPT